MQCLACDAAMQLREVVLADIPTMPGFERHTYSCSACSQVASRLVICRAKMPVVDPLFPSTVPDAPASNVQTQAAGSTLRNAAEKLHSAQTSLEEMEATDWRPTVEGLTKALKERAVASRASAWAKTVEKLRSRQMALKERAATATSPLRKASSPAAQSAVRGEGRAAGTFTDCICYPKSPEDP
jgi:hypothetical protein